MKTISRSLLGASLLGLLVLGAWPVVRVSPSLELVTTAQAVTATREDGALRFALTLPCGPYFRTELAPITLTLTNRPVLPALYTGALASGPCQLAALRVTLTQRGVPVEPLTLPIYYQCPVMLIKPQVLQPGASLQIHTLVGLPASGRLTLATGASLLPPAGFTAPGCRCRTR